MCSCGCLCSATTSLTGARGRVRGAQCGVHGTEYPWGGVEMDRMSRNLSENEANHTVSMFGPLNYCSVFKDKRTSSYVVGEAVVPVLSLSPAV